MDEVKTIRIAEQTPETVMELMGVDRETAEFYIAIERGECPGDVAGLDYSAASSFWRRRSDSELF